MLGKRRGFTLVELAFSVAVLAIIFSVLMPVYERGKEEQRKSTCQNNLKQCGIALQLYWNDYDATLPSSVLAANPPGSTPTTQQTIDFMTSRGYEFPPQATTTRVTWAQLLYDHMKQGDYFYCPSDVPTRRVSYWWKYGMDLAWRDSSIGARKEGDYAYNADQIALYEHAGWHSGDASGIRNGVIVNVVFMDGHVKTVLITCGPASAPSADNERSGVAATRPGSPIYYNWDNDSATLHPGVADYVDPRRYSDHL